MDCDINTTTLTGVAGLNEAFVLLDRFGIARGKGQEEVAELIGGYSPRPGDAIGDPPRYPVVATDFNNDQDEILPGPAKALRLMGRMKPHATLRPEAAAAMAK